MKKFLLPGLLSVLLPACAPFLGFSRAWADAGDDALTAFGFKNYSRALQYARPAAQDGNMLGQLVLGRMYAEGKGVPQDEQEANKWFEQAHGQARLAAKRSDPAAQYVIGRLLEGGWNAAKDPVQAIAWYRKSADQGYAPAQFHLGFAYAHGAAVTKNTGLALTWYLKAAQQGYAPAQLNLGFIYYLGTGTDQDNSGALTWFRKAAEQAVPIAQYMLGYFYEEGLGGLDKDDREALNWYKNAAAQGFTPKDRERRPADLWDAALAANASAAAVEPASAPAAAAPAPPPPEKPYAAIDAALAKGDFKAARNQVAELERGLGADDPIRIGVYRREGTISFREKNVQRARDAFVSGIDLAKKLGARGPETADCFLGLSACLKAEGDVKNAIKLLKKALAVGPSAASKVKIKDALRRLQKAPAAASAPPAEPASSAAPEAPAPAEEPKASAPAAEPATPAPASDSAR
ncbi:MAG: hypothetical protein ACHQ49_12775 [Elusimicrobiota bacterium]